MGKQTWDKQLLQNAFGGPSRTGGRGGGGGWGAGQEEGQQSFTEEPLGYIERGGLVLARQSWEGGTSCGSSDCVQRLSGLTWNCEKSQAEIPMLGGRATCATPEAARGEGGCRKFHLHLPCPGEPVLTADPTDSAFLWTAHQLRR